MITVSTLRQVPANAPWTFGRVLSGLLAVIGLIVLCVGMFLSFISGDGDNFWGRQPVEMDPLTWTCEADAASATQSCESGSHFGEITDKGSTFPLTVSLLGVGLIGVSIMLRLRPQATPAPQPTPQPMSHAQPQFPPAPMSGYPTPPQGGRQPMQ